MTDSVVENWVSTTEAVAALGISERSIRRHAAAGKIKSNRVGKSVYYDLSSWIQGNLEKIEAEDALTTSPYVAVIFTPQNETIVRGQAVGRQTPSTTWMLKAVRSPQSDGGCSVHFPLVTLCLGSNVTERIPNGGLITGEKWDQIKCQPQAQKQLENNILNVFYPQEDSLHYEGSFRAYSVSDSLELVSNTFGLFDLDRWSMSEDRPIVKSAITAQRSEIEQQLEFNRTNVISASDRHRRIFKAK